MKLPVTPELESIFRKIVEENKSSDEWVQMESDDMFQSEHFCGGFDATERAFCFSLYRDDAKEYWFQLTLDEVHALFEHKSSEIEVRPADH
jgi:hypothetical protein